MKYLHLTILIGLLFGHFYTYSKDRFQNNEKVENDSVRIWIDSSRNGKLKRSKREFFLHRAYKESLKEKNDSLRIAYLLKISYTYYAYLKDSLMFRKVNKESIDLSHELNDSLNLGNNYWDLGNFFRNNSVKDSAYFIYVEAQKIFKSLKQDEFSGRMLLNMALIQTDYKDYTGSEVTTIKALTLLKPLNKYLPIYRCYNNLGIIFNELGEYNKAIFYHNKAIEYLSLIKDSKNLKENSLNNIGVVHENRGDYKKAVEYYNLSLENDSLKVLNPKIYARSLDNLASSRLRLDETLNIEKLFLEAYQIRDSLRDYSGMAVSKLHLAEYFAFTNDTIKAIHLADETKQLATIKHNDRDLLASLLLLSKLDKKNSFSYINEYINLEDKLHKQERLIRNKFARIRFETDEYIDENERLSEKSEKLSMQRKRLIIISITGIILSILIYIIVVQRHKNVKLRLEQQQQKANEQIFDLMLVQQYKQDEGRRKEKKRISEELHDGVLGKIFGTRLILNTLNDKTDTESILKRKNYINELQQIEEEVRNVSHELNYKSTVPNIGFIEMLEKLMVNQSTISNFEYQIEYDNNIVWEELSGSLKMNLYRIIQEATQNINKYAKAKKVFIEFNKDKENIKLVINDDGIGFKIKTNGNGIGLKNMKSRINNLNGKISIKSKPNNGTAISIKVPY